ncbi:MAG TPA: hypothetical protein VII92_16695 [Anaerolineae bacterium]
MPVKRKPKKRRAPPAPAPKKRPKAKTRKRAPPKRSRAAKKRSDAAKRGWVTRRKRAKALARERDSDRGDVEVVGKEADAWTVDPRYTPYPTDLFQFRTRDGTTFIQRSPNVLAQGSIAESSDEIVWFPTFDETYDYIDALVDEYDLDAHQMFELAYGYQDEVIG